MQYDLKQIKQNIDNEIYIEMYKRHPEEAIRALIAATNFAPIEYVNDESPLVRLALIHADKWLDKIAATESNKDNILALISRNIINMRWFKFKNKEIREALRKRFAL